jgi:hypothetical protein
LTVAGDPGVGSSQVVPPYPGDVGVSPPLPVVPLEALEFPLLLLHAAAHTIAAAITHAFVRIQSLRLQRFYRGWVK